MFCLIFVSFVSTVFRYWNSFHEDAWFSVSLKIIFENAKVSLTIERDGSDLKMPRCIKSIHCTPCTVYSRLKRLQVPVIQYSFLPMGQTNYCIIYSLPQIVSVLFWEKYCCPSNVSFFSDKCATEVKSKKTCAQKTTRFRPPKWQLNSRQKHFKLHRDLV